MLTQLRLNHGLRWQGKRPPVLRPLFAVVTALLLIVLAASMRYYYGKAQELDRTRYILAGYTKIAADCATQAVQGGTAGFVIGNEAFGMECTLLSRDAYGGLK